MKIRIKENAEFPGFTRRNYSFEERKFLRDNDGELFIAHYQPATGSYQLEVPGYVMVHEDECFVEADDALTLDQAFEDQVKTFTSHWCHFEDYQPYRFTTSHRNLDWKLKLLAQYSEKAARGTWIVFNDSSNPDILNVMLTRI